MDEKDYLIDGEIFHARDIEPFLIEGQSIEDYLVSIGASTGSTQTTTMTKPPPLKIDYTTISSSKNVPKKSLNEHHITAEDLIETDEKGITADDVFSEEEVQVKLRQKLNMIGIDVEETGALNEIIIKPYIDVGVPDYFAHRTSKKLHLTKGNLKENIKIINDFISEHGNLNYYNQTVDNYPELMNKMLKASKWESGLSLDDARKAMRSEEDEKFQKLKASLTVKTWKDGERVEHSSGKTISKKDFNSEEEWNRYKQWDKGEILDPITDKEAKGYIARLEASQRDKLASEFISDLPAAQKRDGEVLAYGLAEIYKENYDNFTILNKKHESDIKIYDEAAKAYQANENPTLEEFTALTETFTNLMQQEEQRDKLLNQLDAESTAVPLALQHFTKNYNRLEQLITGYKGIAGSAAYTLAYASMFLAQNPAGTYKAITSEAYRDAFMEPFVKLKKELALETEGYQHTLQVDELNNMTDVGRWLASSTVNLIPSLSVAFTGAAALPLFFTMGFAEGHGGSEIKQMQAAKDLPKLLEQLEALSKDEDGNDVVPDFFDKLMIQNKIDEAKKILDIPEWKQFSAGVAYGFAEVIFEKFGTMAILKSMKKGIKLLPPDKLLPAIGLATREILTGKVWEGGSELGTTILQNMAGIVFLDENKNVFEGGLETYAQGALMGSGMKAFHTAPMLGHAVTSELSTRAERKKLEAIRDKLSRLTHMKIDAVDARLINKIKEKGKFSKEINEVIEELTGEHKEISLKILDRIGKTLTIQQAYDIGAINKQMRDINGKLWGLRLQTGENAPTSSQLKEIEFDLREKFDELAKQREDMLTDGKVEEENIENHYEIQLNENLRKISEQDKVLTKGDTSRDLLPVGRPEQNLRNQYDALDDKVKQNFIDKQLKDLNLKNSPTKSMKAKAANDAKNEWVNKKFESQINEGIENSKNHGKNVLKLKNPDVWDVIDETDQELANDAVITAFLNAHGVDKESKLDAQATANLSELKKALKNGTFSGMSENGRIIIHKQNAIKLRKIGIGAHELVHHYVTLQKNNKGWESRSRDLLDSLEDSQPDLYIQVKALLDTNYTKQVEDGKDEKGETKYKTVEKAAYNNEILSAISDVLSDKSVKINNDTIGQLQDFVKMIMPDGVYEKSFSKEIQLLDFIRNFNKGAHFGGKTPAKLSKGAVAPEDRDPSKITWGEKGNFSITKAPPKLTENITIGEKNDLFSKTNKEFEDTVKAFGKPWNELSKDNKLVVGLMVGKHWKKFAYSAMASQYSLVPGWNKLGRQMADTLAEGIEVNDNGVPYIVSTWTEGGGRSLTSHIWGLINQRAKHVIQLKKFAAFGKQQVVDPTTGQFDFDRFNVESGNLANTNTSFDAKTDVTGEYRSLLGINVGGELYNKVLKTAKNNLSKNREILDNPKAYRQALKVEFEKVLATPPVGKNGKRIKDENGELIPDEITRLIGTQKSKIFKDFIGDKDTVKTLIRLLGKKYRNRFPIFSTHGGTMKTDVSIANQTSMKGSFVTNTKSGNDIWILQDLDAMNKTELKDYMQQVADFFIKGRETQHKSLKKAFGNELGLDAAHQSTRQDKDLSRQYAGVIGQLTEAIKREPEVNFSLTVHNLNPIKRGIWELNKHEFYDRLESAGNLTADGIRGVWNEVDKFTNEFTEREIKGIVNDFAKNLEIFSKINKDVTEILDPTKDVGTYLDQSVEEFDFETDVKTFLKAPKNASHYYNNLEAIKNYEKYNKNVALAILKEIQKNGIEIEKLDKNGKVVKDKNGKVVIVKKTFTEQEAREYVADQLIKHHKNTVANSGRAGAGVITKKSGEWMEDGIEEHDQRYNLYEGSNHFLELIHSIDPSVTINGKRDKDGNLIKETEQGREPNRWYERNGKRIITRGLVSSQTPSDYIGNKINTTQRKIDAKEARDFIKLFMPIAKKVAAKSGKNSLEQNNSNINLSMLMMGMNSNMKSVIRAAGLLKYVPSKFVKNKKTGDYRYEHMIPSRIIALYLMDIYLGENKSKTDADTLFSTYYVAIIPTDMDKGVGKFFSSRMQRGWKPGQSPLGRYYNMFTLGQLAYENVEKDNKKPPIWKKLKNGSIAIKDINNEDIEHGKFHEAVYNDVFNGNKPSKQDIKLANDVSTAFSITKSAPKGISVFDFDGTVADTKSMIKYKIPKYVRSGAHLYGVFMGKIPAKGKLTPAEFADRHEELKKRGAIFDYSEFDKVIAGKKGPLFDLLEKRAGKFGTGDIFILTARPQTAAGAIQAFMKGMGINIPLKNITGLEDGSPNAKAGWIADKVANGYNDFYFADDVLPNVRAVKDMLEQFDVKSDVQQARVNFSLTISDNFNIILEQTKGVKAEYKYSDVVAARKGAGMRFDFYVPPHAEDMKGFLYAFLGKGKQGNEQWDFLKKAILDPYHRGVAGINVAKHQMKENYKTLIKTHKVGNLLKKETPDGDYGNDHAVRVYLFNKSGWEVPGLSKRDQKKLIKHVENSPQLLSFAQDLMSFPQIGGKYMKPSAHWEVGSIVGDLDNLSNKEGRKKFLQEFIENKDKMFTKENLNKIEVIYGTNFREALEDMLYRMENGTNRNFGKNRIINGFMNWINNSVGAVMFVNMRSAVLQSISTVNFINWSDNNVAKAAAAFGNQLQYWKDFAMIFNSAKLKQRRSGLQINVQEQELANAVQNARNKSSAALSWLLKKGFLPTQIVDSFAIAAGGATMYRNRVNTYIKQGMSKKDAKAQAWLDFSEVADATQQSADPALISQIQASPLGRVLFAWQNTPFQYNRLMKRSYQDLINRRKVPGQTQFQSDMGNISKIIYYGAVQNFIFNALQSALFTMLPGFNGDEDEDEIRQAEKDLTKQIRVANNMADTILRGSGLPGAIVSTVKNIIMEYRKQRAKGYNADHAYTMIQVANLSPPIGSKFRNAYDAIQTEYYERDVIAERGFAPDSPIYEVVGALVQGGFNVPMDRVVSKFHNVTAALDSRNEAWQRVATSLGWSTWNVGVEPFPEHEGIKARAAEWRLEQGKIKAAATRKLNKELDKKAFNIIIDDDKLRAEYYALNSKDRKKYIKNHREKLKKQQNK